MNDRSGQQPQDPSNHEPMPLAGSGGSKGGRGRQSIGEAFLMSMVRQIARSIGNALVRAVVGRRR